MWKNILFFTGFWMGMASCTKFLEEKSNIKLTTPTSLADYQALLDRSDLISNSTPAVGDIGCDDYFIGYNTYQAQSTIVRNCHSWADDTWDGGTVIDWNNPYKVIYYCNVVLDGLKNYPTRDAVEDSIKNTIYGMALFIRTLQHYFLEETFGAPFNPGTASSDLGIPLKLKSDLASVAVRSTVQQVYDQMIQDLNLAAELLPKTVATKNRPTRAAAFALLARIYLTMQDYAKAADNANSALQFNNVLEDYNYNPGPSAATSTSPFPFIPEFPEVIYPSSQVNYGIMRSSELIIDSVLYNSYDDNDLRKSFYFRKNTNLNTWYFKGFYSGNSGRSYSGLTIDELYLIRAECTARAGDKDAAMSDLNALLSKRWKTGTFTEITASDAEDALRKILMERRKELIFRGLRWIDLRRLNQDPRFAITLTRNLNGQIYSLPPNDKRYAFLIPLNEIQANGIPQNPR